MVAEKVQNRTQEFFYKIWPLSRFVGYRPPAFPDFDDSFHSKLIYQLPTKYHERHIAQLREQAENNDKERNGSSQPRHSGETLVDEEGKKAKGEKEEKEKNKTKMQKFGDKSIHMLHTYIASFAAIAFLALSARAAIFFNRGAPVVVAAFATEAVILYSEYQSPLAQPRNIMFGNIICSVLGVCLQKLFLLHPSNWTVGDVYGPIPWVAAAITLSTSILLMQFFEITWVSQASTSSDTLLLTIRGKYSHPPGGATALLAVTLPSVAGMGWFFIVQIVVNSLIVLGWALVINNIFGRRYPTNWWWPSPQIVI